MASSMTAEMLSMDVGYWPFCFLVGRYFIVVLFFNSVR